MPDEFDDPDSQQVSRVKLFTSSPRTGELTAQWIPVKHIGIDPSTSKRIFAALKNGAASAGLIDEYPLQDTYPTPTLELAVRLLTVNPPIICLSPSANSPIRYSLIARFHQIEAISRLKTQHPDQLILCLVVSSAPAAKYADIYADAALSDRLLALKPANRAWDLKKLSTFFMKQLSRTQFAKVLGISTGEFEALRAEQNKATKKDPA